MYRWPKAFQALTRSLDKIILREGETMKTTNYQLGTLFIGLLFLSVGLFTGSSSQALAQQTRNLQPGYCCTNGKTSSSDERNCLKNKGIYYTTKKAAEKGCRKISTSQPVAHKRTNLPVQGFCCVNGDVVTSTEKSCARKKGTFSVERSKADQTCSATKGFCCNQGDVSQTTKAQCKKQKGIFSLDQNKINRVCGATKGFCCDKGNIAKTTKDQCDNKNGIFSLSKAQARRTCDGARGFCCDNGTVANTTKAQCNNKKGVFSITKPDAIRACKYDTSSLSSGRIGQQITKPVRLPDLEITRTWLNRKCVMQVDVKNNGGPIGDKPFSLARMHISAGPNNLIPSKKSYLKLADPAGTLKISGGSVTFNTGLVITSSSDSLVWVDTKHHIAESNEHNNGDDQKLFCKKIIKDNELKPALKKQSTVQIQATPIRLEQKDVAKSLPPPPPGPGPDPTGDAESPVIDLSIEEIEITPESPRLGHDEIFIVVKYKNNGPDDYPSSEFWPPPILTVDINDDPYTKYSKRLYMGSVSGPDEGSTTGYGVNVTIPFNFQGRTLEAGSYVITAALDTTNYSTYEQMDPNPINNHLEKRITIRNPLSSDLAIKRIFLDQWCGIKATISHSGPSIANADFERLNMQIFKDGDLTRTMYLGMNPDVEIRKTGGLWPGAEKTTTYECGLANQPGENDRMNPGETASFKFVLDPESFITDNHRSNNTKEITLNCPY